MNEREKSRSAKNQAARKIKVRGSAKAQTQQRKIKGQKRAQKRQREELRPGARKRKPKKSACPALLGN
jgi:hypothetical protein